MKVEKIPNSKCICDSCKKFTATILVTMEFNDGLWLCEICSKKLKSRLR